MRATPDVRVEQAVLLATLAILVEQAARFAIPAILVEQAARLAMPAVAPAEQHAPDLYGGINAIRPARLRAPPQASAPCRGGPVCPPPLFLSPCPPCSPWSPCRVRCGAGFLACGRLSSRPCPPYAPPSAQPNAAPCRGGPACPPLLLRSPCPSMLSKSRRRKVEQAARLAMPAVTPAEPHNPELRGRPHAIQPARLRAPPQPAAAKWSKPPGLPCRRSRRQSHTIPNAAGAPTPSAPHACALHLKPPPLSPSPYPPCSPWFVFLRVLRVVSDVGQAF